MTSDRLSKLLGISTLLALCAGSQAATYLVSTTGNDRGSGSITSPWRTIKKGLASLKAGDTLQIRGGLYQETLTGISTKQGTATARITVQNYPGERPVIQGLLWLARPSYWTLSGLTVTWPTGTSSLSHMVKMTAGVGWEIVNCEFYGARSYAGLLVAGSSYYPAEPSNWRVAYSSIHDTYPSNNTNQDHCIYVNTGTTTGSGVIEYNLLYNATNGEGVKLGAGDVTGVGSHNVTVRYNTIYNTGQSILIAWKSSNNKVYRNIFQKVGSNYGFIRGYQLTGTGNCAWDNVGYDARYMMLNDAGYVPVDDQGNNTFPLDPLFVSTTQPDLHTQEPFVSGYGRFAVSTTP